MDGRTWSVDLWAYSFECAQDRVIALRETAVIGGQINAIIPAWGKTMSKPPAATRCEGAFAARPQTHKRGFLSG